VRQKTFPIPREDCAILTKWRIVYPENVQRRNSLGAGESGEVEMSDIVFSDVIDAYSAEKSVFGDGGLRYMRGKGFSGAFKNE
jgi:hypothetical protein